MDKIIILERDIDRRVSFEVNQRRIFFDMQPFYELYYKKAVERLRDKILNG